VTVADAIRAIDPSSAATMSILRVAQIRPFGRRGSSPGLVRINGMTIMVSSKPLSPSASFGNRANAAAASVQPVCGLCGAAAVSQSPACTRFHQSVTISGWRAR
jgi:hypothetical protein